MTPEHTQPDSPEPTAGEVLLPAGALHLERTLANGQCFRWRRDPARKAAPPGEEHWQGIVGDRVVWLSRYPGATADRLAFRLLPAGGGAADAAWLRAYLRLDVDLPAIYADWTARDPYLAGLTQSLAGLRLVDQDAEECLLSFTCSKANAIPRIQRAIGELARGWGAPIDAAGKPLYYRFPAATVLAGLNAEEVAARTGLEWRAAGLIDVARQVAAQPPGWLADFRAADYATAHGELTGCAAWAPISPSRLRLARRKLGRTGRYARLSGHARSLYARAARQIADRLALRADRVVLAAPFRPLRRVGPAISVL